MEAAELAAAAAALRTTAAPTARSTATAAGHRSATGARVPFGDPRVQDAAGPRGPVTRGSARPTVRTPCSSVSRPSRSRCSSAASARISFLPSATIVVTPRARAVGPIEVTVVADPERDAPDAEAGVVPAEVVSVDVTVDDTFKATGKRVEETKANGVVRFRNLDFTSSNTIPAGSVVSTPERRPVPDRRRDHGAPGRPRRVHRLPQVRDA